MFKFIGESIRTKLLAAFLALGLIPLLVLGVLAERTASAALQERAVGQLESVANLQKGRLSSLYEDYRRAVNAIASDPEIAQALEAWYAASPEDRGRFSAALSARLARVVKGIPGAFNAHICFVRDEDVKEHAKVIADSLEKGDDQIGQIKANDSYFTGALRTPGKTFLKPFYQSSTGNLGMALSTTIADRKGKVVGVAVLRLTTDGIGGLLAQRVGLGETGESYIVSGDKLMASESRFKKDVVLKQKVDSEAAALGVAGKTGSGTYTNYRGRKVLGYFTWVPEWNVALLTEIDSDEALAAVTTLRWALAAVVGLAAIAVVTGAFFLARGLTNQVDEIKNVFTQVGVGNFAARAAVVSQDELGTAAASLNAMLDNTMSLIQSQDEKERIQSAIQKLLDEISGVAEGDLTKEAEVTADVTGAIADSFNYMIDQLRNIICNVKDATLQVSAAANEVHATAEHLSQGSQGQAEQIVSTSAAVDEMAVSIRQVAENATTSAQVAEQALASAKQGASAVSSTIDGMNRIRGQVQETAKRIKRLGESSQQIGEIVQLIDDIADRTSILALNASIQAAMAGEAGRGFAVVAEEVERLAERSANATKKIANLVKTIQAETTEAVTAMEEGTREVVEGSRLANQAGQELAQIESVSLRLEELIQSISLASRQQARASEGVARSMGEISEVTQQTAAGTRQAAASVSRLAQMANELRSSVTRFRLPVGMSTITDGVSVLGNTGYGRADSVHGNGHGAKDRAGAKR